MRQRPVLELGDDLLDDGVVAVPGVGGDRVQGRVRDERVVPVGGEQFALHGAAPGLGLEAFDAAYDQSAGHVLGFASAGERDEGHLGDFGVGYPSPLGLVPDGVRVADRGPRRLADATDRGYDRGVHPGGHREPHLVADRGADEVPPVVGRVRAGQHLPGHPRRPGGVERLGQQPTRARGGADVAAAQPSRGDHRSRCRGAHRRDLGVEAPHPRVAEPGGLLCVPVNLPDRVINIDERDPIRPATTGEQLGYPPDERGQQTGIHRVQLLDVPMGERAQERAQRRGGPHPVEQPAHPPVAQQVQVVDRIRAGQHPADHARRLHPRTRRGHRQTLAQQVMQPRGLSQPEHRHQTSRGHQISVIEHRTERVRDAFTCEVPLLGRRTRLQQSRSCPPEGHFHITPRTPNPTNPVDQG